MAYVVFAFSAELPKTPGLDIVGNPIELPLLGSAAVRGAVRCFRGRMRRSLLLAISFPRSVLGARKRLTGTCKSFGNIEFRADV